MKIPIFALAALLGIVAQNVQSAPTADENTKLTLNQFNDKFNITDDLSAEEKKEEAEILEEAEKEIEENNKLYKEGKSTYEERLYKTSDESQGDFLEKHTGMNPPENNGQMQRSLGILPIDKDELNTPENLAKIEEVNRQLDREYPNPPATYNDDINNLKYVTKPKAQGDCGSCAAFGEAGLFESVMLRAGAKKEGLDLSEQYLMDCAYRKRRSNGYPYGANGCGGASPGGYTDWFADNGGEGLHEGDYPYRGSDANAVSKCRAAQSIKKWSSGYKVTNAVTADKPSEKKIKQMILKYGAVMSVIEVAGSFGNYARGVWTDREKKCRTPAQLKPGVHAGYNHAALIVGWGREMNTDYWMVKNSWGTNWGLSGFIKVKMGICWIGDVGVWAEAKKVGEADAAPAVDDKEDEAPALWCDITARGKRAKNGEDEMKENGYSQECIWTTIISQVYCKTEGSTQKCRPLRPGPMNGCRYIFGKPKEECPSEPAKSCTLQGTQSGFTGSYTFWWQKWEEYEYYGTKYYQKVWKKSTANCINGVCDKLCKDFCNNDVCWT